MCTERAGVSEQPTIMATADAAEYLRRRVGSLAPTETTMAGWARPSWRATNQALIAERSIPIGVKVPGTGKVGWMRAALDRYADALIAHVRTETGEPETAP